MKRVNVHVINAFVDEGLGGNPAGVVLDADPLSQEEKQRIATEAGFSETTFVSQSHTADFKLDFFTPVRRISDCGHATVAAFCFLAEAGKITEGTTSKEVLDGVFDVYLRDDMTFMEQRVARFSEIDKNAVNDVLLALNTPPSDLLAGVRPVIADNSNRGIIVPLKNRDALRRIRPDFEAVERISEQLQTVDIYPFSLETEKPGRDASARMFAPILGIPEESATGMAAGRLACYLRMIVGNDKDRLLIEQGHLMEPASPSLLIVDLDSRDSPPDRIRVGGRAKGKGIISIDL